MNTTSAQDYVSSLVLVGIEEPKKMDKKQRRILTAFIIDNLTDEDFFEYFIESINPELFKVSMAMFLRFDRNLDRNSLLRELEANMECALDSEVETLFMDELERHENERMDFDNLNYSHPNVHYL